MESLTEDRKSISEISLPEISQSQKHLLANEFSYFRIIFNNSFFEALSLNLFETLILLQNISLIKRHQELASKQKINQGDPKINQSIKYLFDSNSILTFEIVKNYFSKFTTYLKNLLSATLEENSKTSEFYQDLTKQKLDLMFKNIELDTFQESVFKLAACSIGMSIIIHDISNKSEIKKKRFDPINFQNSLTTIDILRFNQFSYLILYSNKNLKFYTEIKSKVINYKNCSVCSLESEKLLLSKCNHFYHYNCINDLKRCKICSEWLLFKCFGCQNTVLNGYTCENEHFLCNQCLICATQNLSDSSCPFFECPQCSVPQNAKNIKLLCKNCRKFRFIFDFISLSCPSNHDFLCRMCWVQSLFVDSSICPFEKKVHKTFCMMVKKILSVECQKCNQFRPRFYGDLICRNNCLVCYTCQYEFSKISEVKTCINCSSSLEMKRDSWDNLSRSHTEITPE